MDHTLLRLTTLEDAKQELLKLSKSTEIKAPQWNLNKILVHCTQTIEYSMTGYPKLKPKFIQATIGKIVISKFLKQGFMKHDLTAPVPGAPDLSIESLEQAMSGLNSAINKFIAHSGELYPHLIFGKLSKSDYDKYFAMHIAEHLSELDY